MNTTLQHRTRSAFAAVALLAAQSAHAAGPYYWDGNDGAAGFGTAGGTWAAPTTGTTTAGWSTDSTGATLVNGNSITTATTDALNFGNGATGLAAGTITVSGTVSAGSMTFASGSGAITLGASVSAGTIEFGATTPTITVNNSAGDTINSVIDGTAGFSFSAASAGYTLSLLGANTLTGGITINSGSLRTGAAGLNAATPNALIFNGSATILANIDTAVCSGITINNGSTVTIANNTKTLTCTGPVTGVNDGGIILGQSGQGKDVVNLNSTANTFTGPIQFKDTGGNQVSSLTVNSLADSASLGAGNITLGASAASGTSSHDFYYGSGAIAPLTLNNRRFVLASSQVNQSINNASSQAITINTDLSYTGTGAKTLSLGSTGTGLSTFAGKLVDLGGANTLQIKKTGAGTWALSGANTYIGATTIAASGGTLSLSSIDVVANANPLGQSSAAAGNLLLGNGTTLKYTGGAASTDRAFTINGTSAGHSATLDASGTGAINFTSTTSPAYGTAAQTRTLILTGSNTGANTLAANIGNNTTAAVSLTKNGGGTWVLSGANTYTGATTVSQGTLLVNGSLNASSAVSVASTATLGGSGTINGTVTVSTGGAIQPSTSGIANTLHLANSAAPTYPSGANYGTLKIRASGTALDSVNFSTAAAHSVANLDLHIDCANLSGPVSSVTIYSVASGDMSGTAFHSVTLDNNSAGYSATLHYNATTITVDLTVSAPDTTPPSWISGWPKVDILTPTGFTARAEIDEAGTSYYVVIAGGASAPSAAQVKAGTDASGAAALKSGSLTMAANTENAAAITGLSPSTAYDVWFVAQDAVPNLQASPTVVSTVTQTPDTTPPNPNPMTFAVAPARMSDTTISMTATTATDSQSPPVQYYFENTTNSTNSGWTSSTVWTQTGLTPTQAYSYRVKAMDAVGNPTTWSDAVTVAPLALASGTWNVDQTGIWDATANWITTPVGNVPNGAGNSAFLTFNITAARTVTIDTIPRTLGTLRTGDSDTTHSYTLAATGGATLTFDNGSSHAHLNQSAKSKGDTLDNTLPILLNGSLDIVNTSANALTVAGTITANSAGVMTLSNLGSGAVTLSGNIANGSGTMAILQDGANSTLVLSGAANTFTGDTTVNSGTLQVATAGAFNSIPRAVTVNTGGVLTATADTANAYTNCAISLNGGKVVFGRASGNITAGGNLIVNATSELDSYQANNATTPSFNTTVSYGTLDFAADGCTLNLSDTGLSINYRPAGTRSRFTGSIISYSDTVNMVTNYPADSRGMPTFELNNTAIRVGKMLTVTQQNDFDVTATYGAAASLTGSLGVSLLGGAELLDTDFFALFDASTLTGYSPTPAFSDSSTFDTTSGLWSKTDAGTNTIAATLATPVGSIADGGSATFPATGAACVSLTGLTVGSTCKLTLTLANPANQATVMAQLAKNPAFSNVAAAGTGQVDLEFTAPAETSYFVWDNVHTSEANWFLGDNLTGVALLVPLKLVSIVDDKNGGLIAPNTLVTYTVTFSKDMDASTVTAADFGNAGTAAVSIGAVTETSPTSGIFTVQATPTTFGTLILKINAGAVLKDAAGIALDTTTAIPDDTTIPVHQLATMTYVLGINPTSSTTFAAVDVASLFTWIAKGSLPAGSILRFVTATDLRLEFNPNNSWASDLSLFVDPTPETPGGPDGLLCIGADSNFGGAVTVLNWSGGDGPGPFTDTRVAGVDFPATIDLSTAAVMLGNGFDPGAKYSGSITIAYDDDTPPPLAGSYDAWKSVNAPTGTAADDYDGDGVSNAVEYVLGGSKNTNDSSKLPKISTVSGNRVFTFTRDQASINATTTVEIEVGTTLATWPTTYTVGTDTASSTPGVTVLKDSPTAGFDAVTLTLEPASDATKFARLKVVITP